MSNNRFRLILVILVAILLIFPSGHFSSAATDQERIAELQRQIRELEEQAEQYRDAIGEQQEQAKTLQGRINSLRSQISQIQVQIQLTGKNIDKTSIQIGDLQSDILNTEEKIEYQKRTISDIIVYLNRQDDENLLETFIKNQNLSDFLRQEQYARSMNSNLLGLVNDLKESRDRLQANKNNFEEKKQDLIQLREQQTVQRQSLDGVKSSTDLLLKQTKNQEAAYQKLLAETEAKRALFFSELLELETQIIQGGLYIVRVKANPLPKRGTKLFQWPSVSRRVTQGYGCTKYARCGNKRGAYGGAPHNGIDIASGMSTPIKAIADGVIVANGKNDGWGNWVAIQHPGAYNLVSVYGHMSALSFLRVGTNVSVGQVIGYEGSTGNSSGSHLHLSIYKEFFTFVNEARKGQLYFNYFDGSINPLDFL
ncbi:MAG: Peptidase M23 [Candidatus Yanofskybacteria bacterium GW2011_GWA1_48_10]|uniref:Peptidase M23 n=2 Tax=Candidatus Yanofskyibacteriota TaxID=1752733 RepID=A0A0G1X701_9BACT|nr:MAG: Peptidase M23 [Candidatus Yanofskybacteria bacterium GW2011_GWA1_48_10]OGN06590.1 MAG: hypothetical protein A2669_03025 [Candidatus Yanofskybacteria bacterium RIFCSPHIGHO2_01_FULL_48_25b]